MMMVGRNSGNTTTLPKISTLSNRTTNFFRIRAAPLSVLRVVMTFRRVLLIRTSLRMFRPLAFLDIVLARLEASVLTLVRCTLRRFPRASVMMSLSTLCVVLLLLMLMLHMMFGLSVVVMFLVRSTIATFGVIPSRIPVWLPRRTSTRLHATM